MMQPSALQSLWDHLSSAATHSPIGGGGLARAYYRLRGYSDQDIDRAIAAHDTDVAHRDAQSHDIGHKAASLVGGLLGGVDPTYAIGGGAGLARRALIQGAVQAPASAVRQGINIQTGMQKHFSKREVLDDAANAVAGTALLEGGGQLVGKLARVAKDHFSPPKTMTDADLQGPDDLGQPNIVEAEQPSTFAQAETNARLAPKDGPAPVEPQPTPDSPPPTLTDADLQPPVETPAPVEAPASQAPPAELTDADLQAPTTPVEPTEVDPEAPQGPLTSEGRVHGPFEELATDDPNGNKYLNYTTNAGDKLPIKMGIEPDGTAEMAIDQFGSGANKLGPVEIRQAMYHLQDMYPEIKRFGGFRRSGAGAGRVQEITPPARNILTNEAGSVTPPQWLSDLFQGKKNRPDIGDVPPEDMPPETRIAKAITEAYPALNEQEAARHEERINRMGKLLQAANSTTGVDRVHAKLKTLEGELPTFDFTSIHNHVTPDELNHLADKIENYPTLTPFEKLHGQLGLKKLVQPEGARIPTKSELEVLRKVFPEIADAVDKKTPWMDRLAQAITSAAGVPRALMSSGDLSAPLRQGAMMVGEKAFYTSFGHMLSHFIKEFGPEAHAEANFKNMMDEISARPTFPLMEQGGLALTGTGKDISKREEAFMGSWAEKIPLGVGRIVRGSDRAYVMFLNKLRADHFDNVIKDARSAGVEVNQRLVKSLADYINTFTGRASLGNGKFLGVGEQNATMLAQALFSPRLIASRVKALTGYHTLAPSSAPYIKWRAFKSLATFAGITASLLALAKLNGFKVEANPESTDFGKMVDGDVHTDITGGAGAYISLAAREAMKTKITSTGKIVRLNTDKYNSETRATVLGDFLRNKEAPDLSTIHDYMDGKNSVGDPFSWKDQAEEKLLPMVSGDMRKIVEERGAKGLEYAPADVFGAGVQVYNNRPKKSKPGRNPFSGGGGSNPFKAGNAKGPF